tara:strand:+ start:728 stop:1267 length:540 start_codon:yes stop_codon:yes gene_type:complete
MAQGNTKFWASDNAEPKRAYRFILSIKGIESWVITKVTRPSISISESSHQYLNHTFYYPGRIEYNTVSFTLVDPITPNSTAYMLGIFAQSGYSLPSRDKFSTISKKRSTGAMGTPQIHTYNADGDKIESFALVNAWVKNVDFGEFDYSSDDLLNIGVELRYDFVKYEGAPAGSSAVKFS